MVLKCLVNSSQLTGATPTGHSLQQAIGNLGQQQLMKPYKDGSELVNFLPSGQCLSECLCLSVDLSPSFFLLQPLSRSLLVA